MLKALTLPKGAKEELNYPPEVADKILKGEPLFEEGNKENEVEDEEAEDNEREKKEGLTEEQKLLMIMFGEGRYHLIPSFFRTLIFLKKQKREFSVVFRTFGKDLKEIVWEFNQFCSGQHPCYSGRNGTPLIKFDGSKGTKDLRIRDSSQKGMFYRFSDDLADSKLVCGTFNRMTENFDELKDILDSDEKYEDCQVLQEPIQIFQNMLETLKKFSSMAILDDYNNWKENEYSNEVSKLLLIDQADYNTQHIFFDDNADA
jgi:hypothetical protein